jgi:hypothetical protein
MLKKCFELPQLYPDYQSGCCSTPLTELAEFTDTFVMLSHRVERPAKPLQEPGEADGRDYAALL